MNNEYRQLKSAAHTHIYVYVLRVLKITFVSLLFYVVFALVAPQETFAQTTWNSSDWTERVPITIDSANIDSTLIDFPVYVDLNDLPTEFWDGVSSDGGDIRIMNEALTTEMPVEVVSIDTGTDSGELHFRANLLNSFSFASSTFYLYWNGSTTADYAEDATYGSENVWSNSYVMVHHFEEGDSTATDFYVDSTANDHDGTLVDVDGDTTENTTAQLGSGINFNGDADSIDIDSLTSLNIPTEGNVSLWFNRDTSLAQQRLLGLDGVFELRVPTTGIVSYELFHGGAGAPVSTGGVGTGSWVHISADYDDSVTNVNGYINGSADGSGAVSGTNPTATSFSIGTRFNPKGDYVDGSIDEVRVSSVQRASVWIDVEHLNQSAPTTFYTIGAAEDNTPAEIAGITISGTLFSDQGGSAITTSKNLALAVGTSTPSVQATTSVSSTGAYSFTVATSSLSATTTMIIFINGETETAATALKISSTTASVTGVDLYQNHLILQHNYNATSGQSITTNDIAFYDNADDSDLKYRVSTSSAANALEVLSPWQILVSTSTIFDTIGGITLQGQGSSTLPTDGTLELSASSTINVQGPLSIAGSLIKPSTATFNNTYSNDVVFTATSTGKQIRGEFVGPANRFQNVTFDGVDGSWFLSKASTSDFIIATGTVYASANFTIDGDLINSGTFISQNSDLTLQAGGFEYMAGRDVDGSGTGIGSEIMESLVVSGNYLFGGYGSNSTACSQTAGSAFGCEIKVFDISDPTNPTYVAGIDADGSSGGTGSASVFSVAIAGEYLFVGSGANSTACSQIAGSAIGCELKVFDISDPTNPTYVAGIDADGSNTGITNESVFNLTASGNYLYLGQIGDTTACSQTTGSARGCELKVFDISDPTNPTYIAGRDVDGSETGTTNESIRRGGLAVSGNYLYVGHDANLTACSQIAGSAQGCELKVFDISDPTNPTYVAGIDADGSSGGSSGESINTLAVSGNYIFVAPGNDSTACSQVAGSAIGCELKVFDISDPTNPTYVAGRDSDGSSAGTNSVLITSLTVSGNYLYAGHAGSATACSQIAGSARGCELKVFDISDPTNPTYIAGRDVDGSTTGTNSSRVDGLVVFGNYLFSAQNNNTTACSQTAGSAVGCELKVFTKFTTPSLTGTFVGEEALGDVTLQGNNYLALLGNASTSDFTITADAATTTLPYQLTISGDFIVNSDDPVYNNGGTIFLTGENKLISGNFTGDQALYNITLTGAVKKQFSGTASTSDFTIAGFGYVATGSASTTVKISDNENGGPSGLDGSDTFGSAVANIGDLNGDGVTDVAVGASGDEATSAGDGFEGALHILFMNSDGTVDSTVKISDNENGGPSGLDGSDRFGSAVANIGDLNGDGVTDVAVGAPDDEATSSGDAGEGALHILFMNSDGTVDSTVKISDAENGGPSGLDGTDGFGSSVANLGDLNGDGVTDVAVGASGDEATSGGSSSEGAIHILFMNSDGTVDSTVKISDAENGGPSGLDSFDNFGSAVANVGDLNGDGVVDLVVGARFDEATSGGDSGEGALHILFMNSDGTVDSTVKISDNENGGPSGLDGFDRLGGSVTNLGDLNGDGVTDVVAGAGLDEATSGGDSGEGALHILFMNSDGTVDSTVKISDNENGGPSGLDGNDFFGSSVTNLGDFNDDGVIDLAVGAASDEATSGGNGSEGALHILFMDRLATTSVVVNDLSMQGDYTNNGIASFATGATTTFGPGDGYVISSTTVGENVAEYSIGSFIALFDFAPDGKTLYIYDVTPDEIIEYSLTTPWDITARTEVARLDVNSSGGFSDFAFSVDGRYLYIVGDSSANLYTYTLASPWRLSSVSGTPTQTNPFSSFDSNPDNIRFKPDGTKLYIYGGSSDDLAEYDLLEPWNVATAQLVQEIDQSSDQWFGPFAFNPDGTRIYRIGVAGTFTQFNTLSLTNPWDISTLGTAVNTYSFADEYSVGVYDIFFKPDAGTSLFLMGFVSSSQRLREFPLASAPQTATGTMTGDSAFYDLTIDNTGSNGTTTRSFTFGAAASSTGTFTITASSSVAFAAGATSTFQNVEWVGSSTSPVWLYSTATGTQWSVVVPGTSTISYVNVQDSYACGSASGGLTTATGTNVANNTCWTFGSVAEALQFILSGALYSDEGVTEITSGHTITVAIATSSTPTVFSTTTDNAAGTWQFTVDAGDIATSTTIFTVFVDGDVSTRAATVVKEIVSGATSTTIANIPLYENRVISQDRTGQGMFASDFDSYDGTDDSDIQFTSEGGGQTDIFSVRSQENAPTAIFMTSDGLKMYIAGNGGDEVNEYELARAFEPLSATFRHATSVAAQDVNPAGLTFNPDGTKMFIMGRQTRAVYEYALDTAFDVSTAAFTQSTSTIAYDTGPHDVQFNPNGTIMYVVGDAGNAIDVLTLSSAFDVSTAAFSLSYSIGDQESSPRDVKFNDDGTKMFVLGLIGDDINEYTLSSPFDLSSTVTFVDSFNVFEKVYAHDGESAPGGLFFNDDGTKVFVVGEQFDSVITYDLPAPYDISTGVRSFSVAAGNELYVATGTRLAATLPTTVHANAASSLLDGSIRLTASTTLDVLDNLTIGGSLRASSTAFFDNEMQDTITFTASTTGKEVRGSFVGAQSLVSPVFAGDGGEWTLTEDVEVDDFTVVSGSVIQPNTLIVSGEFNNTGTYSNEAGSTTLDAAFRITEARFLHATSLTGISDQPQGGAFSPDGTKFFTADTSSDEIIEFAVSTPFDVSTMAFTHATSVAAQDTVPTDLAFNTDGTKLFVLGSQFDDVSEYALSAPYDVSTASFVDTTLVSQDTASNGLAFNPDGTRMYIAGASNDNIYEYTVTTGFDLSSGISLSHTLDVSGIDFTVQGIAFNTDGTKMFISGDNNDYIRQFSLSTGFDLATAEPAPYFLEVGTEQGQLKDILFSPDGTRFYTVGLSNDEINQYNLFTAPNHQGTLTFGNLTIESGTHRFTTASTSNITITSSSSLYVRDELRVGADYFNAGMVSYDPNAALQFASSGPQLIYGDLVGENALGNVELVGDGAKTIASNASTTDFTIASGTAVVAPRVLSIAGDYTNANGPFVHNGSQLIFTGASSTITGSLSGNASLYDVIVQSAVRKNFASSASTTNMTISGVAVIGDGTVDSTVKISDAENGGPDGLGALDKFGSAVANIGDLNGDGVTDLAVGASVDEATSGGDSAEGALFILFMNSDGTVDSTVKISDNENGGPSGLDSEDVFGTAVANIGDLNGDGVTDLAVGATGDEATSGGDSSEGALFILFMNSDGTVDSTVKISDAENGGPSGLDGFDRFGISVATIGDLNGDGVTDLAVGARFDEATSGGDSSEGALFILFMNSDGTVDSTVKISDNENGGPSGLDSSDEFGTAVTNLGDLNGDGVTDLAVGARFDEATSGGNAFEGALYILFMNSDGTVDSTVKISDSENGGPSGLDSSDSFGSAVANLGDLNGDGVTDLAVGARFDEATSGGDSSEGALFILFMNSDGTVDSTVKISDNENGGPSGLDSSDAFGAALANLGDLNGDGVTDLAVGAESDEATSSGDTAEGALHILFMSSSTATSTAVFAGDLSIQGDYTNLGTASFSSNSETIFGPGEGWVLSSSTEAVGNLNLFSLPIGVSFKPDGTVMHIIRNTSNLLYQYDLSTPWDVTSATLDTNISPTGLNGAQDVAFRPDGMMYFTADNNSNTIRAYSLTSSWDIAGSEASATFITGGGQQGLRFTPDGRQLFVVFSTTIRVYDLTTPWDITTASLATTETVSTEDGSAQGIDFAPDGSRMYMIGSANQAIYTYDLTTPWDITTRDFIGSFRVSSEETDPQDVFFSQDGTNAYIVGLTDGDVDQYAIAAQPQTATGTMTGAAAFNDLTISNTGSNGTTSQSVIFGAPASTTGTFTMQASSSARFLANATNTFQNIDLRGNVNEPIFIRSSATGTQTIWDVPGTQVDVVMVDVRDNYAVQNITVTNGEDSGNNTNWTFITAAAPFWNSTDWTTYDTIRIESDNIDEDLTDFPVYIDLADLSSDFWSTTPAGASVVGTDIRVTTNDGSPVELPRELVTASSTLETGELHFKANFISSSVDTVFRVYYNGTTTGDYGVTDPYGAENVWTNGYVGVYHLNEEGNSDTGGYLDSTAFSHDGTGVSMTSASDVSGQLGTAQDFDGSFDYISIADTVDNRVGTSDFTTSAWIRPPDSNQAGFAVSKRENSGQFVQWSMGIGSSNSFGSLLSGKNFVYFTVQNEFNRMFEYTTAEVANDTWRHTVLTREGSSDTEVYIDGAVASLTTSRNVGSKPYNLGNTVPWNIARGNGTAIYEGEVDEVRLANTTRSSGWIGAEHLNQSTTTDFYSVNFIPPVGSSTISDHDDTQVNNAFDFQNKTNEPLFGFKITPNSGNATVTELVIGVSGVTDIDPTDFSNIRLYRDLDSDGEYDASEPEIGGVGALVIAEQLGSITFSADFLSTTSQNYLVVADWNAPVKDAALVLDLWPDNITAIDSDGTHDFFGEVDDIQHNRLSKSGGGGGVDDPIIGRATTTGGTQGGGDAIDDGDDDGENIVDDPQFLKPSSDGSPNMEFSNSDQAYESDGSHASTISGDERHSYSGFGFSIPVSNEIVGIEVKLDGSYNASPATFAVYLSWNNGVNYTSPQTTPTINFASDQVYTLGGPSDTWGRSWVPSDFDDGSLVLDVVISESFVDLDALQINVYNQAGGGGAGGGGSI